MRRPLLRLLLSQWIATADALSVQLPGFTVVIKHDGRRHAGAADTGEGPDAHPHGEVSLVDALAVGAA